MGPAAKALPQKRVLSLCSLMLQPPGGMIQAQLIGKAVCLIIKRGWKCTSKCN